MSSKKIIIIIIVFFSILGIWQYRKSAENDTKIRNITPYTVKRGTIKETMTLSGKIDAEEKVSLQFQSSGRLAWVGTKEGDLVKKYQTLASLDQRDIKKRLDKYLNTYLKYRWDLEQSRDDNQKTVDIGISREIRDRAKRLIEKSQFDLNNSVLDVELQDLALQYSSLTTPISGIVTRMDNPVPGVNITALYSTIEVVNPSTIYLSILGDQTEITDISKNQSAEIIFDSFPDEHIQGNVTSIAFSPKQGETSIVYEIKLSLPVDNSTMHYKIGMTADAEFTINEKLNALIIPRSYIKDENGNRYVLMNKDNKNAKTPIIQGMESDSEIEITSGLNEGDIIYDL